jgi:hypothetical protein
MIESDRRRSIQVDQSFTHDVLEEMIGNALTEAGIGWVHENHPDRAHEKRIDGQRTLDFKLANGLYIEVKHLYSERSVQQMASAPNVILIQGLEAAKWFCEMLRVTQICKSS